MLAPFRRSTSRPTTITTHLALLILEQQIIHACHANEVDEKKKNKIAVLSSRVEESGRMRRTSFRNAGEFCGNWFVARDIEFW